MKPFDSRGRIMGFTDNVYDQKRGQRNSTASNGMRGRLASVIQIAGRKRQLSSSEMESVTPLRKLELPTPEPDFATRMDLRISRPSPPYALDPHFDLSQQGGGGHSQILPSIKSLPDQQLFTPSSADEHLLVGNSPAGMAALASAAVTQGRLISSPGHAHTLAPMLSHTPLLPRHNGTILHNGHSTTAGPLYSPPKSQTAQSNIDKSISQLDSRIASLRTYEEEFIELDLDDSRKLLQDKITELEADLRLLKKQKSLQLAERLVREGFGGLADGVRKEIERWDEKSETADMSMSVGSVMNANGNGIDAG